jgi:hypothetical protein
VFSQKNELGTVLDKVIKGGRWNDPIWRLNTLYKGVNEDGEAFPFRMNEEQHNLITRLWTRNNILKARQIGFTTFIQLLALDQVIWNSNYQASLIADTQDNAFKIFRLKVLKPLDELLPGLKDVVHSNIISRTSHELVLKNGSSISAGLSPRGGTTQLLHISEFGKIAAKFPDKAEEIFTGGFGSVHKNGLIFVESTAEGQSGRFFDITMEAKRLADSDVRLNRLQFRLHFYPWYLKKTYVLSDDEAKRVKITDQMVKYFSDLEVKHGIPELTHNQKAWYQTTESVLQDKMKREYPSYPQEAFEVAIEGSIYERQMTMLRKSQRIGRYPWDPSKPVNTFWDFGVSDKTSIWFHQTIGAAHRFFRCHVDSGLGLDAYVKLLKESDYTLATHYVPHDADHRVNGAQIKTKKTILEELGLRNIKVVSRIPSIKTGIEMVRQRLPMAEFDADGCQPGIAALDAYRWGWDKSRGQYTDDPYHDWASHPCDAIRVWAEGFQFYVARPSTGSGIASNRRSWRTV